MAAKKTVKQAQGTELSLERQIARAMGGSLVDDFNAAVATQALRSLWLAHSTKEDIPKHQTTVIAAMVGIAPKNEIEGMLAAQMVATHHAAMECFRRAMLKEQSFECWREQVSLGSKLVRSYAALLDALDRHRGKGQPQVVRVERVTVEAGGQAIVGAVTQGGRGSAESEDQPHAQQQLAHAPEPEVRGTDAQWEPVPVASSER